MECNREPDGNAALTDGERFSALDPVVAFIGQTSIEADSLSPDAIRCLGGDQVTDPRISSESPPVATSQDRGALF